MKTKAPPRPTRSEYEDLNNWFYMQDWEFEKLFVQNCTEVASHIVGWEKEIAQYAKVYGINAMYATTKKPLLSNFFIRFGNRVYRCSSMVCATEMLYLLDKHFEYNQHREALWQRRQDIREKKNDQKKSKAQLKVA